MGRTDRRVDAYIAKSATFAQPIMRHLRQLVHEACPDVRETIKWGFPHFEYHGIMCSIATFKQHCTFGFWKASIMKDPYGLLTGVGKTSMGHFGKIRSIADLPSEAQLKAYIKEAARLNEGAVKVPRVTTRKARKPLRVPEYFKKALARNKKALKAFEEFSPSHKRGYVEWVTEARTDETRERRLKTTVKLLTEGKARNWKYMK